MRNLKRPVQTRIMGLSGWVDTLISPMDSIRHQKTLLHAGLMSIDPQNGEIKAWVGDLDYQWSQFDNVIQSRRQVGSTFKPFVYATAIRLGLDPCTELPNQKTCIEMPEGPGSVVSRKQRLGLRRNGHLGICPWPIL